MTDRIVIFYGSKKDFEELVATETSKEQVTIAKSSGKLLLSRKTSGFWRKYLRALAQFFLIKPMLEARV